MKVGFRNLPQLPPGDEEGYVDPGRLAGAVLIIEEADSNELSWLGQPGNGDDKLFRLMKSPGLRGEALVATAWGLDRPYLLSDLGTLGREKR